MEPSTRKALTIWWVVILACMIAPWPLTRVVNLGALAAIAWFAAIPVAIMTFRRSPREAHLDHPGWYRTTLVLQLLIALVGMLAAARTVLVDGRPGLITIATVNLGTAVLTWRAITGPGPRPAVAAAIAAGTCAFVALLVDIALDINLTGMRGPIVSSFWTGLAVFCVLLSWIGGGLVCLASIHCFGEKANLPDARVA